MLLDSDLISIKTFLRPSSSHSTRILAFYPILSSNTIIILLHFNHMTNAKRKFPEIFGMMHRNNDISILKQSEQNLTLSHKCFSTFDSKSWNLHDDAIPCASKLTTWGRFLCNEITKNMIPRVIKKLQRKLISFSSLHLFFVTFSFLHFN